MWLTAAVALTVLLAGIWLDQQAAAVLYAAQINSPSVVSPGYLQPVTGAALVSPYQIMMAAAVASGQVSFGTSADYAIGDVDGDPGNPRWVAVLSKYQTAANALSDQWTGIPPSFPSQLRTDGVLDFATATLMVQTL